jgi:hypothetical protein
VSIANRRGSVSHDNGGNESKRTAGNASVSSSVVSRTKTWRKSLDLTSDAGGLDDDDVITPPTAVDDIESPRTPKYFPRELSLASNRLGGGLHHTGRSNGLPDHLITPLLPATLRGGGGGGGAGGRVKSGSSSIGNLSTPYSTLSGISNYEYEDDFTSEEEEQEEENLRFSSHRRSSSRPSSRIPISRSSSLHRRKNLLRNGNTSGTPAAMGGAAVVAGSAQRPRAPSPLDPPPSSFVQGGRVKHSPVGSPRDDRRRDSLIVTEYEVQEKTPPSVDRDSEYPALSSQPSAATLNNRSRRKRTQSVPPGSQAARNNSTAVGSGENVSGAPLAAAKSAIELSSAAAAQLAAESDTTSSALVSLPQTEPPTRRYNHSISVPGENIQWITELCTMEIDTFFRYCTLYYASDH